MLEIKDLTGAALAIENNMRITSINNEACEYYVSDVQSKQAASPYPYLRKWPFKIQSTELQTDGSVQSGDLTSASGQVKFYSAKEIAKQDPNSPVGKGHILAWASEQHKSTARLVKIVFTDEMQSQAYAEAYIINAVSIIWVGGDIDAGEPGEPNETSLPVKYKSVELKSEVNHDLFSERVGEALVTVSLEDISLAAIESAHHFTIQKKGGQSERYTLVNGGVKHLASHHVELELVRSK